jgi:hypothetical protein
MPRGPTSVPAGVGEVGRSTAKASGFAPGVTARDANGDTWFVSPIRRRIEGGNRAVVIANRFFWARRQPGRNVLTRIDPARRIDAKATIRGLRRTPFTGTI